ncbi:MAG: MepB family protein [Chlamydiia bacterium]
MTLVKDEQRIEVRTAKITPKKIGQFVTLYKRIGEGPILPYDADDPVDAVLIHVRAENRSGRFVFPKEVLIAQGVFSVGGKGGKRAIRIYPPWDTPQSLQAKKSQDWQVPYFIKSNP